MTMTFDDILRGRRSVRLFSQEEIASEILDQILEAGRIAPSACNRQPWHFYAMRSDDAKQQIRSCYKSPWFGGATSYILITGRHDEAWRFKDDLCDSTHIDTSIAMTQMMLKAYELGLASTWVCAFDRQRCATLLGLDFEKEEPISILALGYPVAGHTVEETPRKPVTDVISYL